MRWCYGKSVNDLSATCQQQGGVPFFKFTIAFCVCVFSTKIVREIKNDNLPTNDLSISTPSVPDWGFFFVVYCVSKPCIVCFTILCGVIRNGEEKKMAQCMI